jgi:hypothetical protein
VPFGSVLHKAVEGEIASVALRRRLARKWTFVKAADFERIPAHCTIPGQIVRPTHHGSGIVS